MAETDASEPLKPAATDAAPHAEDTISFEPDGGEDVAFEPAEPLKEAAGSAAPDAAAGTAQALKDGATKLTGQATDRARAYAEEGKAKATDMLDEFARMLKDAAGQVDDRLGPQFGQYAHSASDRIAGFAEGFRGKDVDDLVEDARGFVRTSPAIAVGAAAAVGFVLARLMKSGLEAGDDRKA